MARVSQQHLDARRRQIIDAARVCFADNGFHATSMQDVLKRAGLSAGAVYRYFPGKEELISAVAEDALAKVTTAFGDALVQEPPPAPHQLFGAVVRGLEALEGPHQAGRIAVQAWAEALRSPSVAELLRPNIRTARAKLAQVVVRYQKSGLVDPAADPVDVATVLLSVIPGFVVQSVVVGDVDADTFLRGLRGLFPGMAAQAEEGRAEESEQADGGAVTPPRAPAAPR